MEFYTFVLYQQFFQKKQIYPHLIFIYGAD